MSDDPILGHGCKPREAAIAERIDAGEAPAAIAAALGVTVAYVRHVGGLYAERNLFTAEVRFAASARAGCEAMERAVRATGRLYS